MIQRVQSIYLFLAGLCAVALLFFPTVTFTAIQGTIGTELSITTTGQYIKNTGGEWQQLEFFPTTAILNGLIAVVALINVFLFKNRLRQIQLCWLNSFFTVILSILMINKVQPDYYGAIENWQLGVGGYLYTAIILLHVLAIRGIREDEKLVRSADRLR